MNYRHASYDSSSGPCLTEVFGEGTVSCAPDILRIRVSANHVAKTTDAARAGLRRTQDKVYEQIRVLQQQGVRLPETGLQSHYAVAPLYGDSSWPRFRREYEATFFVVLESPDIEQVAPIVEALAQVEGAAIDSPTFHLSERRCQAERDQAFKRAVAAAKARFAFQCRVIGFDPDDYEVSSWRYQRSFSWGSGKCVSIDGDDVSVGSDRAEIKATVYLTYDTKRERGLDGSSLKSA